MKSHFHQLRKLARTRQKISSTGLLIGTYLLVLLTGLLFKILSS